MKTVRPFCASNQPEYLTAYLAMPYSPRDLVEMIRRLLPEGQGAER